MASRASYIAEGLKARYLEHQWSYDKWAAKKIRLAWALTFAIAATASSVTTALTKTAELGWVAGLFGLLAAGVTEYQRRFQPEETAAAHKLAADRFGTLLTDYRDFIQVELPARSLERAVEEFDKLQERRQKLIDQSIAVEGGAREAVASEKQSRRDV